MKQKLLFLTLFFSALLPAQEIQWDKSYGGIQAEYLMDALATADYGYILAGSSLSIKSGNKSDNNKGDLDYWLWKMKENGDLDWQKSFGGSGTDFLESIDKTNDGGFVLAGTSSSNKGLDKKEDSHGEDDFWIIKLNARGEQEWQKTIGGSGQERLHVIKQTLDGGYILGGSSSSLPSNIPTEGTDALFAEKKSIGEKTTTNFGNLDYWIVKLDRSGNILWQKSYGGIYFDELRSIEQTKDGGYIVGGYSNSPSPLAPKGGIGEKLDDNKGVGDFWVLKIDRNGNEQWQRTIGGNLDDQLYVVHQTHDGNFIVGGNSNSSVSFDKTVSNRNGTDFWLLKLDLDGNIIWQETYDIGVLDVLTSLLENKDHSIVLGGYAKSELEQNGTFSAKQKDKKGTNDFVVIKITENGEETWRKTVGSTGEDLLKKAIETRDGGYLLAGTSKPVSPLTSREIGTSSKEGTPSSVGTGYRINEVQNQGLQNATNEAHGAITDVKNDLNKEVNDTMGGITDKINNAIGGNKETGLQYGLNSPLANIALPSISSSGSGAGVLDGLANTMDEKQGKRGTGDQTRVFGSNDFWAVKLKDENKPKVEKARIEALPNPVLGFTNIIVGYDYIKGTASVYDLAGRALQSFAITSRTVPIDFSDLPYGIYIVNIKTNVQSDGIKVIKGY